MNAVNFAAEKITKIIGESFTVIVNWQWTFLLLIAQRGDNVKQFTGIPSTLTDLFKDVYSRAPCCVLVAYFTTGIFV